MFRSAGPLTGRSQEGEGAYSSHLRHQDIALDAAERSCLTQLEKIRSKKEEVKGARPKSTSAPPASSTQKGKPKSTAAPPAASADGVKDQKPKEKLSSVPQKVPVVHLDDQDAAMRIHPGRKLRRGAETPAEVLDRSEEAEEQESSWQTVPPP